MAPIHDAYSIEVEGGAELSAKGNVVEHGDKVEQDGKKVVEISKRWFRVRDKLGRVLELSCPARRSPESPDPLVISGAS